MIDTIGGKKESDPLCQFCYAARVASHPRLSGPGKAYEGLTVIQGGEPLWTGRVSFIEKHLADPIKWKKPRRIFVNSMSDLFHEKLDFDMVDQIMYVMAKADWHIYQVLTKRVGRALEYMTSSPARMELVGRMKHVHWGASIGTQRHADLRMPIVCQWPVSMRWLSMEPLLGGVNLGRWLPHDFSMDIAVGACEDCGEGRHHDAHNWVEVGPGASAPAIPSPISWIVVGGESGPLSKIRPTPHHFFRYIRDQAERASVPFFMKQLSQLDMTAGFTDIENFPEDLRIQQPAREVADGLL